MDRSRQVKGILTEKANDTANDLLKNLNPKEALAVLDMAKPLIEYLKSKGSPYYSIIITENKIKVVYDELCIPFKND